MATQLKKTYTSFAQAIAKSQLENGPLDTWEYVYNDAFFRKYIIPYMQVQKVCGFSTEQGCFPKNIKYKKIDNSGTISNPHDSQTTYKVILNDGTLLSFRMNINCVADKKRCLFIDFDINGHKKPNQIGRDLFAINTYPFVNNVMPYGIYNDSSYNEQTHSWNLRSKTSIDNDCNTSHASNSGWACSAKIMLEGWKMNY